MPITINGSTGIGGVDGSAGTPAYQGTDTNTGISFGTDVVIASTGGTERLRITSTGNVGIGASSPATTLEVGGVGKFWTGVTGALGTVALGDNGTAVYNVGIFRGAANSISSAGNWLNVGGYDGIAFSVSNAALGSQTERARIDSSGRLLVGTSTARSNYFNSNYGGIFQVETANNETGRVNTFTYGVAGGQGPIIAFGKHRSNSTGGTTIVSSGDELGVVTFQGSDGTEFVEAAQIAAQVDGTPGANDMPGRLVFSTTADGASSPTERMRITSNGDFLFQAVSTLASSTGFLRSPEETGNTLVKKFIIGEFGKSNISYPGQWSFHTSSGWGGSVFKEGFRLHLRNYDSGSATESVDLFRFDGNGGFANYSAFNTNLSDINAKKDVTSAVSTWDCLKQWEIVNYRYKTQKDTDCINIGVIAQQVSESCPEVVTVFQAAQEETDSQPALDELLGIKEQQMYWMAIKALQEAMERIETLEARITTLEAN